MPLPSTPLPPTSGMAAWPIAPRWSFNVPCAPAGKVLATAKASVV